MCREAGVPEEIHDAITGHDDDSVSRSYGERHLLKTQQEQLAQLPRIAILAGLLKSWGPRTSDEIAIIRPDASLSRSHGVAKMVKPRVFIGSSVEGLAVAYAVQQNLTHHAEATVWTQGTFELSQTTMESLNRSLEENDFAIFVFSPDDLTSIRNTTQNTVRDNVLFEFGLFIGKLGRHRVFFLQPDKGDLHLPSDLLGVTAGKYDAERSDGNLQAATGGPCHQIANQVKKLGLVTPSHGDEEKKAGGVSEEPEQVNWIHDFIDSKYSEAKSKLESELNKKEGEELLSSKAWIEYCDFKVRNNGDIQPLLKFSDAHPESIAAQCRIATILQTEGYVDRAIKLLTDARVRAPHNSTYSLALAECLKDNGDIEQAIEILKDAVPEHDPKIAIALSEYLESQPDLACALFTIQACYANHPGNESVRYRYARLAQTANEHHIALFLLDRLTNDFPKNISYWGHFGNTCLDLKLYDLALFSYREAESLTTEGSSSQWITANIGNIFRAKGFYREACGYFKKALIHDPSSEYTHDRMALALKSKSEELKVLADYCAQGRRGVRSAISNTEKPTDD